MSISLTEADQAREEQINLLFAALADPTRRDIVRRLAHGSIAISELAGAYDMTLPGVTRHLSVLKRADFVRTEKTGRTTVCHVIPETFDLVADQVDEYRKFWSDKLDAFKNFVEQEYGMGESVELKREIKAPTELVYRAISRGMLFRDTGILNDSLEMDFRTGGRYRFDWISGGTVDGEFIEIVPHRKVVLTWRTTGVEAPTQGWTTVTIDLEAHGRHTSMSLRHDDIPAGKSLEDHKSGWETSLDDFLTDMGRLADASEHDWGEQRIRMTFPGPPEELFDRWLTVESLSEFFITDGVFTTGDGKKRDSSDPARDGDRYQFTLANGTSVYGRVTSVEAHRRITMTFGQTDLELIFRPHDDGCEIEIHQTGIPTFDEARVLYHIVQRDEFMQALCTFGRMLE